MKENNTIINLWRGPLIEWAENDVRLCWGGVGKHTRVEHFLDETIHVLKNTQYDANLLTPIKIYKQT